MARLTLVTALALTGSSSALQIPLQLPFDTPWTSHRHVVTADEAGKLPLVDSETLQSKISFHTLESRSKVLYDIAKKAEEEYGHPTRVIGSAGESLKYAIKARYCRRSRLLVQATMGPLVTSHLFWQSWALTTTSAPRSSPPSRAMYPSPASSLVMRSPGRHPPWASPLPRETTSLYMVT